MRQITNFQTHYNHANEAIDATHINQIQTAINEAERLQAQVAKRHFETDALFVLSNSANANAMQLFSSETNFGQSSFPPTGFEDHQQQGIAMAPGLLSASFKTDKQRGHLAHSKLNAFTLMVDCFIPVGSSIEYYLTTKNGASSQRLHPNSKYDFHPAPLQLKEGVTDYQLTVIMKANQANQSPILYNAALLFHDEAVDEHFEF